MATITMNDIHSLTDFQRNTKSHVRRLKETGRPEVLTVNGRPEVIVQDAQSYQTLLDELDRLQAIEGIKRGLGEMKAGRGRSAKSVFGDLRKKHKIKA